MKKDLIKKIIARAETTKKLRLDIRYKNTMGFLVAKGLLYTNQNITPLPNARLKIKDVIWAGEQIEPRILEVLPAAICRFTKHFEKNEDKELLAVIAAIKKRQEDGPDFRGIPYKKLTTWLNLNLKDKRTKTVNEKRIPKNFRLKPETTIKLRKLAEINKTTETDFLEMLIYKSVNP